MPAKSVGFERRWRECRSERSDFGVVFVNVGKSNLILAALA